MAGYKDVPCWCPEDDAPASCRSHSADTRLTPERGTKGWHRNGARIHTKLQVLSWAWIAKPLATEIQVQHQA